MKMRVFRTLLLAFGPLTALWGCGSTCTAIGCTTYVDLVFSEPLTDEGTYLIEVVADGEEMSCEVSIPSNSDDTCDDDIGIVREEIMSVDDDAESGRAGDFIESIGVIGVYDELSITVTFDDESIIEEELEPDYEGEEINGAGCGECPRAEHELAVE